MSSDKKTPVLNVISLTHQYARSTPPAVEDLDFHVDRGEIFGFLGPNGAGKTTSISVMATLMKPTRGRVEICGVDSVKHPAQVRKKIGFVPQDIALYQGLTGRENLHYFGTMYGLKGKILRQKTQMMLDFFDIGEAADRPVAVFSGGIKRRFNIACGILHDPHLIFLDEPTVGMDLPSRNALLDLVEALSRSGCAIVYTTHHMDEAEKICSRVLVMDGGACLASGSPAELIAGNDACKDLGDLFLSLTGKGLAD